jgi:hypothetical protein
MNRNLVPDKNSQIQKWLGIPKARITACALILPADLDFDTWAAIGPKLATLKRFSAWALGDWLAQGEIVFGETYSQACDVTGLAPEYLMILKSIASRIAPERRRPILSFSHHKIVAPLDPVEQDKMLDAAEKNQWTRDEMSEAVREFKQQIGGDDDRHDRDGDRDGTPTDETSVSAELVDKPVDNNIEAAIQRLDRAINHELRLFHRRDSRPEEYIAIGKWLQERVADWNTWLEGESCGTVIEVK